MDIGAPRGSWDFRRRSAVAGLKFCALVILVSLLPFVEREKATAAINAAFALAGMIFGTYVLASTTHDYLHKDKPADRPKPPPVASVDEPIS